MQLYAITDRRLFPSIEALIEEAAVWATGGVDFIQIREKDLRPPDLAALAAAIVQAVRATGSHACVLLNGPAEIASTAGCDGIHLTSNQPESAIEKAKEVLRKTIANPVITISCHTLGAIEHARDQGATAAVFASVFEKRLDSGTARGQGLESLAEACRLAAPMPVFALGGITAENAQQCIAAGAAGIAAIRLFAHGAWTSLRRA